MSIWLARPRSVSTPHVKKKFPVPLMLHNIGVWMDLNMNN